MPYAVSGSSFEWKTLEGGYIVPGTTIHEDIIKDTLVINETSVGFWIWEANGQLRWSEGKEQKWKVFQ